jgi:LPXTG-motif cell wall-anchored protein
MPTLFSRGRLVLAALTTAAAVALAPAAPAWAHNSLAEASPAKNATLTKAPFEVKLRFLQKLDPAATSITVTDAAKKAVAVSKPSVDGPTGRVRFARLVDNGTYTVAYDVTSRDGHKVKGSYQFKVAVAGARALSETQVQAPPPPPSAHTTNATTATAVATKAAADDEPGSGGAGTTIAIVAGALVLAGIGGGVLLSRRRRS